MQYLLAVSSAHVNSRMQLLHAGGGGIQPLNSQSLLSETELGEQSKYVTAITLST